ncbi:MAG: MFS transporter [Desmonostoc vinosum HA7617-LM4]|jgi:Na+/melibiose symporter-like transporter|nr:MFS transporter [Desmonostoc vinosum HA7617-LM4]
MSTSKSPNILWVQVWVLAAVQGAITLTWLIYGLYLPRLLTQFGFPASLAVGILIIDNALSAVMEPLMGGLSDQAKRWMGSRFPFISVGVILSATLFIAIPCIVVFVQPTDIMRSLLPLTLIAWALTMTVFRSPVISLLAQSAIPTELPLAVSFVTLAGGIIAAFRPIANKFIFGLGPVLTFAIGSFVLLAAAAILRFVNPPEAPVERHYVQIVQLPSKELALILGTGFGVAWGSRFLMDTLGKVLSAEFSNSSIDVLMVWIGLAIAFASLPAGAFAVKIGNRQAMLVGVCATISALLLIVYTGSQFPIIAIIIAGFSLIINGAIPFALRLVSQQWAGLGIGMYFGGFAVAMSLFALIFPKIQEFSPFVSAIAGASAFLLAGICIATSGILVTQRDAEV